MAQTSAQTKRPTMEEILASPRSTFVDVEHMPWTASKFPGVEVKILYQDEATGMLTVLTRMAPGSFIPLHIHTDIEQTYVLEGSLVCGEGVCRAGEFVWRPAGSRHEAWAGPEGGLMLGMFQMPNRFFQTDGRAVDFLGNDWDKAWGAALARHEQAQLA